MRFRIRHLTRYRYSAPVHFADHLLRLKPRAEGVRDLRYELRIEPEPVAVEESVDSEGNPHTRLRFEAMADRLTVDSRFSLSTERPASIVGTKLPSLPWRPSDDPDRAIYFDAEGIEPTVRDFAVRLSAAAGGDPLGFVSLLTRDLFINTDRQIRPDGHAHSAAHTLLTRNGACRDLTVLFMAACRCLGMPARFVSGYQARGESVDGRRHLHAWPEVWLPGIGWRGYDPTHGMAVSDGHVALAAGVNQAAAMPIVGGFFGDNITSTLDYEIEIEASEEAASPA